MIDKQRSVATEHDAEHCLGEPLLGGAQLRSALGFRSGEAFRAAARGGRLPVAVMKIQGRRGWFAKTEEVSAWVRSLPAQAANRSAPVEDPKEGDTDG